MKGKLAIATVLLLASSGLAGSATQWFQDGTFSSIKKDVIAEFGIGAWKRLEEAFSIRQTEDKTSASGKSYIRATACVPHACDQQATVWVQVGSGKVIAICFMNGFPNSTEHKFEWIGKAESGGGNWSETRVNLFEGDNNPCDSNPPGWTIK